MRKSIAFLVIFLTVLTFVVLGVIGILSNGDSLRLSLLAFVIGAIIYRHQLLRVLAKKFSSQPTNLDGGSTSPTNLDSEFYSGDSGGNGGDGGGGE